MRYAVASAFCVAIVSHFQSASAQTRDTTVIQARAPQKAGVGHLDEELVLGKGSVADVYTFTSPDLYTGRNGSIYVVDANRLADRSIVRQYDREGVFLRQIGRNGTGPGEYTHVVGSVRELSDGRILLSDPKGVLVFSALGAPITRWSARSRSVNVGRELLVDPSGFVYAEHLISFRGSSTCGATMNRVLLAFRLDGTIADTIPFPFDSVTKTHMMMGCTRIPFAPELLLTWSPLGYYVTAFNSTYSIDMRKAGSRTNSTANTPAFWRPEDGVLSIRRAVSPVQIQRGERTEYREAVELSIRRRPTIGSAWQWTGPGIPTVKPPVREISVSDDGRIWVRLSQPAEFRSHMPSAVENLAPGDYLDVSKVARRWFEPHVRDVFEPDGTYVGQLRIPDAVVGRFVARGDTVWAITRDEDNVPTVKRYRIKWGG